MVSCYILLSVTIFHLPRQGFNCDPLKCNSSYQTQRKCQPVNNAKFLRKVFFCGTLPVAPFEKRATVRLLQSYRSVFGYESSLKIPLFRHFALFYDVNGSYLFRVLC